MLRINPRNEKAKRLLDTLVEQNFPSEPVQKNNATPLTSTLPSSTPSIIRSSPNTTVIAIVMILCFTVFAIVVFMFILKPMIYAMQPTPTPLPTSTQLSTSTPLPIPNYYQKEAYYAITKYRDAFQVVLDRAPNDYFAEIDPILSALIDLDEAAHLIEKLPIPPDDLAEVNTWVQKLVPETYSMTSDFRTGFEIFIWDYSESNTGNYVLNPNYDKSAYGNGMSHLKIIYAYLSHIPSP
jgi:hypothetical protein